MMQSEDTIRKLADDRAWRGGWYQDITLPDGARTVSSTVDFDKYPSRSVEEKWNIIERFMTGGRFLDIGCNAGGYLVKASELYTELYGIDPSTHFLKQCNYILGEFHLSRAEVFCNDALEFDFQKLPPIDTTIMINTLYWLGFTDEQGARADRDELLDLFMGRLRYATRDLVTVGCETVDRTGGSLARTLDLIGRHFQIIESGTVLFPDRPLNYIYARSQDYRDH